jgi:hypothetical protein
MSKARIPWGYIVVGLLSLITFWIFVSGEEYPVQLAGKRGVYLGISVVEQDFSTILQGINDNNHNVNTAKNDWLTSFLLQSPDPAALIYLDYIRFDQDADLPAEICFKQIIVTKSGDIPVQIAPEVIPDGLEITSDNYKYTFPPERCMEEGKRYIMPHILLGVLPVNASANFLGIANVSGYRASDYFPLDRQKITFDVSIELEDGKTFSPSMEAVVAQKGWEGQFALNENGLPVLHLNRIDFYSWVLLPFFVIMAVAIPYLNNIVDDIGGFLEIAFGLLLGLWGTHEIFTPNYISTSIPIDIIIYLLFILLITEIMLTLAPEINKFFITIHVEDKGTESEKTVIENRGPLSVNLSQAYLSNYLSKNIYPLPPIRIPGRRSSVHKIIIWTRKPIDTDPTSNRYITYFYMEKDNPVWTNAEHEVLLKAPNNKTLSKFPL